MCLLGVYADVHQDPAVRGPGVAHQRQALQRLQGPLRSKVRREAAGKSGRVSSENR